MSNFRIREHVVRTQHTRDRPAGAERRRGKDLRLHVKQYIPKSNPDPNPGDVTIIGAQANGFPKEVYEPFWDDFVERLRGRGREVRSIWLADIASQGQSGVLNEKLLGPDASWWDHGRDLLFFINQWQDEMPHPIVGIGHSVGASHLAHLSLLHPRLLDSLVLVDPIMQRDLSPHKAFARLSTTRRDVWPSREVAREKFEASKFYQAWDPRVLEKFVEFGLRELPTELYPDAAKFTGEGNREGEGGGKPVTLTTTREQEVYFYLRAVYRDDRLLQKDDEDLLNDVDPEDRESLDIPFARPECQELYRRLPELKPPVLYIFGSRSEASPPEYRKAKMERTGTGVGGSGGAAKGKVEEVVLECGHLVGLEKTTECAEAAAAFVATQIKNWEDEESLRDRKLEGLSRADRLDMNELWRQRLGVREKGTKL